MKFSAVTVCFMLCLPASAFAQDRSLPEGELTLFAGNNFAANFVVENSIERIGDTVNLMTFRFYPDGMPEPGGPITYDTTLMTINCALRTFHRLRVDAFDASGRYYNSLAAEPVTPIEPDQTWDFVARIVCDGVRFGPEATVTGYEAARALALAAIRPHAG